LLYHRKLATLVENAVMDNSAWKPFAARVECIEAIITEIKAHNGTVPTPIVLQGTKDLEEVLKNAVELLSPVQHNLSWLELSLPDRLKRVHDALSPETAKKIDEIRQEMDSIMNRLTLGVSLALARAPSFDDIRMIMREELSHEDEQGTTGAVLQQRVRFKPSDVIINKKKELVAARPARFTSVQCTGKGRWQSRW
jgi:hypothetical protein